LFSIFKVLYLISQVNKHAAQVRGHNRWDNTKRWHT
jgi:hypothetical protein